jgi:lysylphosphatidylglycerol synthetase-like protein (DUF2156 family)
MSIAHSLKEKVIKHARFPMNPSILIRELEYFRSKNGMIGYSEIGNQRVVAGEPIEFIDGGDLWSQFVTDSRGKGFKICGYYTSESFSWNEAHFVACGTSSIVDLNKWTLQGAEFSESRRAFNHKSRKDFKVYPLKEFCKREGAQESLLDCFIEWKNQKPNLDVGFIINNKAPYINLMTPFEDWWVLLEGDKVSAYLSLLPYKSGQAFYLDHLIQNPLGDKFALDALIVHCLHFYKERGVSEISFGLNPFDGLRWKLGLESLLKIGQYFLPNYSASGLSYFKSKFGSTDKKKRYMFYEKSLNPVLAFSSLAKVSFNWSPPFDT